MTSRIGSADLSSLTSALIDATDQLLAVYDLADAAGQTLDEQAACEAVLERSARILDAEAMVLRSGDRQVTVGEPEATRRLSCGAIDDPGDQMTIVTAEHAGGLYGELAALRPDPFSTGDRKLLTTALRLALGAISTARLHQQVVRRALDERDRQRAAEIAQLALRRRRPDVDEVDLFVTNQPAMDTGGDFFCLAEPSTDGVFRFAVGDVAGKGLTAAVMMTTAICATNAAFGDPARPEPDSQLAGISRWTHDHLDESGLFITMFIGHYRPSDGRLTWSNAGHSPCLLHRAGSDRWIELPAHTVPLGVLPNLSSRSDAVHLAPGDLLVIGSDGLVEQENPLGQRFGDAGVRSCLRNVADQPISDVGQHLLDELDRFADGVDRLDDRTLLLLRRRS